VGLYRPPQVCGGGKRESEASQRNPPVCRSTPRGRKGKEISALSSTSRFLDRGHKVVLNARKDPGILSIPLNGKRLEVST